MPRSLRYAAPGCIHHVWNRGNRRQAIFHKPGDYKAFIRILVEARHRFGIQLISFCVMKNHWHLVIKPTDRVSISAYMHWVTSTHVRRYQLHYDIVGSGHVYQRRFKNRVCRNSERRLLVLIRYVEANPLKAGLVRRSEQWRWSSLWLRLHGDPDGLLAECPIALPAEWADYLTQSTKRKESKRKRRAARAG
jgi:putative transposase